MRSFFPASHALHAPSHEFFRGTLVPCHETPARADSVRDALLASGRHAVEAPVADSRDLLARVHRPRYLHFLEHAWDEWVVLDPANADRQPWPSTWPVRTLRSDREPREFSARLGLYSFDSGTPLSSGTWAAAKAGADAALSAVHAVQQGTRAAFSASRPPGHHAGPDFMGGYCFLNNAAVAAQALVEGGCARVAVLDVDYHHGNGTQAIFEARADVLFVSVHGDPATEYPFFLGHADEIGVGEGRGFTLNLPLPAGSPSSAWFAALETGCARVLEHAPEALVVSLGLDTFEGDPISHFKLSTHDFHRLGQRIARLGRPTVFILEGGYATDRLGANALAVLDGFEEAAHGH
jgi:acetoin utilization deacetylase AcuC-like enzyme